MIHEARKEGGGGVKRAESLNGNEIFIGALADLASAHLWSGARCSKQLGLRCQGCRSERCKEQKKFFAGGADAGGGEASVLFSNFNSLS